MSRWPNDTTEHVHGPECCGRDCRDERVIDGATAIG
jgi:hypothetical protein